MPILFIVLLFSLITLLINLLVKHNRKIEEEYNFCKKDQPHEFTKWESFITFQRKTCKKCGFATDRSI